MADFKEPTTVEGWERLQKKYLDYANYARGEADRLRRDVHLRWKQEEETKLHEQVEMAKSIMLETSAGMITLWQFVEMVVEHPEDAPTIVFLDR